MRPTPRTTSRGMLGADARLAAAVRLRSQRLRAAALAALVRGRRNNATQSSPAAHAADAALRPGIGCPPGAAGQACVPAPPDIELCARPFVAGECGCGRANHGAMSKTRDFSEPAP